MYGASSLALEVHTDLSIIDLEESDGQPTSFIDWIFLFRLLIISVIVIRNRSSGIDLSLGLKCDLEGLLRYLEVLLLCGKIVGNLSHKFSGVEH